MKYMASFELKDETRCDGCPYARILDGYNRVFCTLGEFEVRIEKGNNGHYTPRPRGCPLTKEQGKSNQLIREYYENLKPGQRMIPKNGDNS